MATLKEIVNHYYFTRYGVGHHGTHTQSWLQVMYGLKGERKMKVITRTKIRKLIDTCADTLNKEHINLGVLSDYADGKITFTQFAWADALLGYEIEHGTKVPDDIKSSLYVAIADELRKCVWSNTLGENGYWIDTRYTFDRGWETMVFRKRNGKVDYKHVIDQMRYEEPEDALEGHMKIYEKWRERIA